MIKLLGEYVAFAKHHTLARCPFFYKRKNGEILLGMNIYWGSPTITHDWNTGQRPYVISGRTIEELLQCEPRGVGNEHGLPPAFVELHDGSLLGAYNRWREVSLGTAEANTALNDPRVIPLIRTHLDEVRGKDKNPVSSKERADQLGLDDASHVDTMGILQPIRIVRSTDGGKTWLPWTIISSDPKVPLGTSFRGNFIQTSDGELLFSVNWQEKPDQSRFSYLMSSRDNGKTWSKKGTIAGDPENKISYVETSIYQTPGGELVALVRNNTRKIAITRSQDGGATWAKPHITDIWGYPCDMLPHSSGQVLVTYGHRTAPCGVVGRVVKSDLSDFEEATPTYIDQFIFESGVGGGYPTAIELEDGTVLVAYFCRRTHYGATQVLIRHISIS